MKRFMFASALALSLGMSAQGADYYVDATAALRLRSGQAKGGDGSAKAPFATIQQAADVAQAGDTVFVKPGTYCESVKPKNSGKDGSPITFRNCPGEEKPLICGGDRVTGPWTLEGNGIYWAPCNWGMKVPGQNQVVVDGDLMIEARWPNIAGKEQLATARRLSGESGGLAILAVMQFNKDDVVVANSPKWAADFWKGGVAWGVGGWSARSALITGSQASGADHRMTVGTNKNDKTDWWNNFAGGAAPGFLAGARGALDHEKEFFLDEAAGRLYLMAPGGVDPSGLAVYAKKRVTLIDMSGLTNVVFTQVNTMMGGITLNNATRCALQNGRHLYSSHFYLMPSGRGDAVLGTTWDDPAGAAVYVSGESNRIEGCEIAYAATGVRLDGRNHVVRNCVITDIYIGSYFGGIFIGDFYPVGGECGGHLIERNTISRTGRGAVYWNEHKNGEPIKTTYTKCRVLYNHISDFMENTEDGGAVYAWCVWANGTEVAYNWIHGEHGGYAFNPALYADDVTADFRYHHNVIWDVKLGIGWNRARGGHEAYNNTIWSRNGSLTMTTRAGGCKTYNNLSNKPFNREFENDLRNNLTAGGFVGNPDKPTSGLDFRLATNSPAINAGVAIPGVTDGAIGAPDVGAYELGGAEWIPGAGTEPVAPAVPVEFSATATSAHGIRLGWSDNAFNERAYTVERSTDGKTWTPVAALPADAFSYADVGFHLKAGTPYQYRLAATNGYGRSAYVNASATTVATVKAPVITGPLAATAREGIAFSYTITAASDADGVAATGLPKGLSLNLTTGVISGYPEEAGEAKVKITATNAKGSDTKALALTIAKAEPVVATGATVTEYTDLPAPPSLLPPAGREGWQAGAGGQAGADGIRWTVLTFTNNGSFTVSGGPAEYFIVAGGGGGGAAGGGGAGGVVTGSVNSVKGAHKVVIGAGGGYRTNGEPSSIIGPSIYWAATGGGRGSDTYGNGSDGGSGGGAGKDKGNGGRSVYPNMFGGQRALATKQGNRGGDGVGYRGAGGGGAGGVGEKGSSNSKPGPAGGPGLSLAMDGTTKWYAGGGGGGGSGLGGNPGGPGGSGVGGKGFGPDGPATDGAVNTGGGGGAGGDGAPGGKGGSGIVIVRFVRTGN